MLTHSLITRTRELRALAPEWESLMGVVRGPEVTRSPAWAIAWWDVYRELGRRALRIVALRRDGRLVGVVPLLLRRGALRRLELIGSGEPERHETCSEYLGLPTAPGEEQSAVTALIHLLATGSLGAWDEISLTRLSAQDPMVPLLAEALRDVGGVSTAVTGAAPHVPLPASWADYVRSLSRSRRERVRRTLRAFERWTDGTHVIRRVTDREELERGLDILERLHGERWSAPDRKGAFASPFFRRFHRQVAPELLDRGALELIWLELGGRPLVVQYNLIAGRRVQFYQGGRITDAPKDVRLGVVLHLMCIRRAIEAGRDEYDFLDGLRPYKLELSSEIRPLLRLQVRRASLRTKAVRAVEAGREAAMTLRRLLRAAPRGQRRASTTTASGAAVPA